MKGARMQTLIDPFELASRAPLAHTTAPAPVRDGGDASAPAARAARSPEPTKTPYADAWTRVRWWCSEE